ncbi:chemosensory receptor A [Elysia marginata]|uniref:Chemosensory receptor A n=1 Tax=Elysia marginata TaxID=1093978 RepID=A0AAV4HMC4_9GAST|nr:chemosensory receptor A [Elysia marginata]
MESSTTVFYLTRTAVEYPFKDDFYRTVKVLTPLCSCIVLFGFVSNIMNILVFLKSGARDNVTVLLLSLAVSDLLYLSLIAPSVGTTLIHSYFKSYVESWPFDYRVLLYLPYWPAFTAYDLSAFISVSMGVMRCACVAMPLKFKLVFSRSRTVKWVLFLVVLAVSLRLPVLTINRLGWRTDPLTNDTYAHVKSVKLDYMSKINDIVNRGVLIYLSYVTMVTCVLILTVKLYEASKIRRLCSTTGFSQTLDKQVADKPLVQGLSSKDLQVVKSVVLVCTIFILSQLPFLLVSTTRLFKQEFNTGKRLAYLFATLSQVSKVFSYLNASLNIFVYYNYNNKYRTVLRSLLCTKQKQ